MRVYLYLIRTIAIKTRIKKLLGIFIEISVNEIGRCKMGEKRHHSMSVLIRLFHTFVYVIHQIVNVIRQSPTYRQLERLIMGGET